MSVRQAIGSLTAVALIVGALAACTCPMTSTTETAAGCCPDEAGWRASPSECCAHALEETDAATPPSATVDLTPQHPSLARWVAALPAGFVKLRPHIGLRAGTTTHTILRS